MKDYINVVGRYTLLVQSCRVHRLPGTIELNIRYILGRNIPQGCYPRGYKMSEHMHVFSTTDRCVSLQQAYVFSHLHQDMPSGIVEKQ